jgi:predicted transcriptional regulator
MYYTVFLSKKVFFMGKKLGISLRIEEGKIEELDQLAQVTHRDRSFLINEAIENYLEVQKWQVEHIKAAIQQADGGNFASESDVESVLKKWQS